MSFVEFAGELDGPTGFVPFDGELDGPAPAEDLTRPAGVLRRSIPAGPKQRAGSVLDDVYMPEPEFDAAEAQRLSRRDYAERTPIPGTPEKLRPSLEQGAVPKAGTAATARGQAVADSGIPGARIAGQTAAGIGAGVGGAMRAAGDVLGLDALTRAGEATAAGAGEFERGIGDVGPVGGFGPKSPVPYLGRMAEGAASSLGQSAILAAFGAGAVIPGMAVMAAGQEYDKARNAGLDPSAALAGAIPKGAFEAIGEKFSGLDKVAGAMGTLLQRGASDQAKRTAADVLVRAGIREIPGEVITYLGQTGVDLLPGIGLNPDLTMSQFVEGLRDTVVQSAMMGGAIGGGGVIARRNTPEPLPSARQMAMDRGFLRQPTAAESIADIGTAGSVDEAIAAAQRAITAPAELPPEMADDVRAITAAPTASGAVDNIAQILGVADAPAQPEGTTDGTTGEPGGLAAGGGAGVAADAGAGLGTAGPAEPGIGRLDPQPVAGDAAAGGAVLPAPATDGSADAVAPVPDLATADPGALLLAAQDPTSPFQQIAAAELKRRETEAAYAQRDQQQDAERAAIVDEARDQQAAQATAASEAAEVEAPTAMQLAMQRARAKAAPAAAGSAPVATESAPAPRNTASAEPASTWYGRRGDGYLTTGDAGLALRTRQKVAPDLDWRVEQTAGGKYRLAGYARAGEAQAPTTPPAAAPARDPRLIPLSQRNVQNAPAATAPQAAPAQAPAAAPQARTAGAARPADAVTGAAASAAPGLVVEIGQDLERLYQADVKADIKARRGLTPALAEPRAKQSPLRSFLRTVGIDPALAADVTGERGLRANQRLPGTFRRGGLQLDELVTLARERGFLTDADVENAGDTGGTRRLVEIIQAELRGERAVATESADDAAQAQAAARASDQLQSEADAMGFDTTGMTDDQVAGSLKRIRRRLVMARARGQRAELAREVEIERAALAVAEFPELSDDMDVALDAGNNATVEDAMRALGFSEQEIRDATSDRSEGARQGGEGRGAGNETATRGTQSRAGSRAGVAGGAQQEGLTSPTRADVEAQQERAGRGERTAEQTRRDEESRARADAERGEFRLTGSDRAADVGEAGGQNPLFSRSSLSAEDLSRTRALLDIYSRLAPRREMATVESVRAAVRQLVGGLGLLPNGLGRIVVATADDIKADWEPLIGPVEIKSESKGDAQGFYSPKTKTVFLIADHIPAGEEMGVAAHELMHKHGQAVLGKEGWDRLHGAISGWADAAPGSIERQVYDEAASRVRSSGAHLSNQELFPYAVQVALEMDVKPNLMAKQGTVERWLAGVVAAMRKAWNTITGKPGEFKAQDLVNLAFGIAQRENPANAAEVAMDERGTTSAVANPEDVAGNQGGRPAGDNTDGAVDESTGLPLNADGTVTLYHHTNAAAAAQIRRTGTLKAQAEPDVYLTTRRETDTGYGDTAVAIRVNPERLQIDDEFPDGRMDFRLSVGRPGGSIKVAVENEPSASNNDDAPAFSRAKPAQPNPWRDSLGRFQFAPGQWLYDKIGDAASPMLIKLGMKAASPELRRQLRQMKLDIEKAKEIAVAVAKETEHLSEAEREMVSDLIEQEVQAGTIPPAHAVKLAKVINVTMEAQTDELVRLGMLTKDAAEMWRGKYLPRYYPPKIGKVVGDAWADALKSISGRTSAMKGIKGKHLKGRGLYETIKPHELPDWEVLGWQVRDPSFDPQTSKDVQVWRDFTRAEREKMGEIRDSGYRFVMGYMETQRDIALGRMFDNMAKDEESSSRLEKPGYVQVPSTKVPGTGAMRYGNLAGRWVPQETMSQLSQIEEAQSDAWQLYRKALGVWKEGKTVLNPVSHVNNILSNVTMAHLGGVSYGRADKYLAAMKDFALKAPGILEAKEAGLFLGTLSDAELMNTLPKTLQMLARQQETMTQKVGRTTMNLLSFYLRKPMGWAYQAEDTFFRYLLYKEARGRGLDPNDAVDYAQKYIFTYDDLPKGARNVRDFALPFFSYTYKAVPALLHTALTHPERAVAPAAVMWAINAAAYAIAAGDDDDSWETSLRRYVTEPEFRKKAREKEELEREFLPPWMKGMTAFATPKSIRLGMDEVTKLPLFIDVSRIIPGGDLFDVSPNAGGLPLPQPITPSHPLFSTAVSMLANKDLFRGKDLVDSNDTRWEATEKRASWLWDQFTPAVAINNYHWERGMSALAQALGGELTYVPDLLGGDATGVGRDGLPVQGKYAAAQTFGIKVRPLDLDTSESIQENQKRKMIRDIDAEISSLRRLYAKGAISSATLDKKRDAALEKKDRLREGLTVDGDARD